MGEEEKDNIISLCLDVDILANGFSTCNFALKLRCFALIPLSLDYIIDIKKKIKLSLP